MTVLLQCILLPDWHSVDTQQNSCWYRSRYLQYVGSMSFTSFCLHWRDFFAATVIYDWSLTFGEEYRLMWKRPTTGPKILFFLNRYLFITLYVVQIIWDLDVVVSNQVSMGTFLVDCQNAKISISRGSPKCSTSECQLTVISRSCLSLGITNSICSISQMLVTSGT